jgi:dihydroflavonol-4-reductase
VPVFLTGATGFLGRHLVALLASRGEAVRAFVRPGTDASFLERHGVEVVRGELRDEEALRRAAAGCGLAYHLAGLVSHRRRDLELLRRVNVEGTRVLLAAVEPQARVVHVSSVSTIGWQTERGRASTEEEPFPPQGERYVYMRTKREAERLAFDAAAAGRDVVVANPGYLIGPDDVYRVTTWMVQRYLQGLMPVVVEGGLSFVDARDVAAGLVLLAERGRPGERWILTNREGNLTLRELLLRVGRVTGVRRPVVEVPPALVLAALRLVPFPASADEAGTLARKFWFYDPAKAERALGFTVRPLDETLEATAAQYRRPGSRRR